MGRQARRQDVRHALHGLDEFLEQRRRLAVDLDDQHTFGRESRIELLQVLQRANEEAGAGQDDEGERDLRADERAQQARAWPRDACAALQRVRRRHGRCRLQRRRDAEEHARRDGDGGRESEDVPVRRQIELEWHWPPARMATRSRPRNVARTTPNAAPTSGEQQALDQQLTDDAAAAGADGEPHRHFSLPRRRAREQQAGDVRARNQQHEPDDAHQHVERLAVDLAQIRPPGAP